MKQALSDGTARFLLDQALQWGADINQALSEGLDLCKTDVEKKVLKLAVGKVMAEILTEIINPICKTHPHLTPDQLT